MKRICGLLFGLTLLLAAQPADTVYVNASILTMDAAGSVAEAMAVRSGLIAAVGTRDAMRTLISPLTRVIDLNGRSILPGFWAAHDHFPEAGVVERIRVDLNSPPIGRMQSIADIVATLRERAAKTPAGEWIVGNGYDDTLLRDKRHPMRHDLDRASLRHPIVIIHTSGHLSVGNSYALRIAGVSRRTPQPQGGLIRKDTAGEPTGVIEESHIIQRHIPKLTPEQWRDAARWANKHYLARGVTTTVIAGASEESVRNLAAALRDDEIRLRVIAMAPADSRPALESLAVPEVQLRLGAVKLFQDGSLQGYTGHLSQPYFIQPAGKAHYRGYSSRTPEKLAAVVLELHRAGFQIAIHGNGDAAIDEILDAYEAALKTFPRQDARHRIEHCQTAREDQLDRMVRLGITPSFFAGHVFYWGDRHRDIFLGPERAARISPLASAVKRGIRFTLHDDTPVTPVNPLQLVWAAVERQTRAGRVLGPDQRITVMQALRALTIDAAWQNFEEQTHGSIEPGKRADFVVLDRNPLSVPGTDLRNLKVLETVVGGSVAWVSPDVAQPRAPYPPGTAISGIRLDWSTHRRNAPGSDNWPFTWADDDHLYGAFGDGGGFGGTNSDGRASLGVARMEGPPETYKGVNLWGGKNARNASTIDGKSYGIVSLRGILYMWVSPGSPLKTMHREARLYQSEDHGVTWKSAGWAFTDSDGLSMPTILQFGKDYAGARDGYVYHYFIHPRDDSEFNVQKPGTIYLARSPVDRIEDRGAFEFYSGSGQRWTADVSRKAAVFEDRENGVGWVVSAGYNSGLKRYLLVTEHTASQRGNWGIFDAPEPWGPWTTVVYGSESEGSQFGAGHVEPNTFFWNFPSKWISTNGQQFTLVFTGAGRGRNNDSLNLIRGRFTIPRRAGDR
jgi:predicted amidohydrolase YtcJ